MIGVFDDVFKKNKVFNPSDELIEALKKNLPTNFDIAKNINGKLAIIPKANSDVKGSVVFEDSDLEYLKDVPKHKRYEYLYRTQHIMHVKKAEIGDDTTKIPISCLGQDPFKDTGLCELKLYPMPFPDPVVVRFETTDGDEFDMQMQQVVHDSWSESKIENVNYRSINIEIYIDDEIEQNNRIKYSVSPQKANSVQEAVRVLHLYRGLLNGSAKINGHTFMAGSVDSDQENGSINDSILFWENALKLEKKIGVSFDTSADFPREDVILFDQLIQCMIERRPLLYQHPFDHFHVGGVSSKEIMMQSIDKDALSLSFIGNSKVVTLLGASFELASYCELKDFCIEKVEWDEDTEGGEIFIKDSQEKEWTMSEFILNRDEVERVSKLLKSDKILNIPKDIDCLL